MGDDRGWSPETNGVEEEEEYWRLAEAVTQEIIEKVQATQVSEERRRAVVDYVQRLIRSSTCCQVFPFGSVPLKTYLPDGDIDLTAVSCLNVGEEALANEVFSVLEREDQNLEAEFVVRDVQLIRAEVKLVKCLVQNIIVDISFNQLGGLSTLCFLEKVALLIGKDHLFKRSIILIKAWCYYESRILGAHHGLISTYALETLVLYIFNLFHSSLNGPFTVLYKFLEYFSKFDWDTYCITMNGPVRISSLPEFVVERHEIGRCDMLVGDDFFKECVQTFSVSAREFEADSRVFPPKHLNIVDPLRENNNLGRSVSKGNFFRIKSAFTYGARKLGLIMSLPEENVASELQNFFSNTLERHGIGQRPDLQDHVPIDEPYGFGTSFSFSSKESNFEDHILATSESVDFSGVIEGCADYTSRKTGNGMSSSEMENEEPNSVNWTAFSGNRLIGDAVDLASSRNQGLLISKDVLKSCMSSFGPSITPVKKAYHAPHADNGKMENGNSEWNQVEGSGLPAVLLVPGEEMTRVVCTDLDGRFHTDQQFLSPDTAKNDHFNSVAHFSADFSRGYCCDQAVASIAGSPKAFNYLADLSGDYDCHMNNLNNSRCLYEYALKSPVSSMPSAFVSHLQNKGSGDFTRQSARRNAISLVDGPRTAMLYLNPSLIPAAAFGMDEMPKPRGTGTYFPNTNHDRDRVSTTRVRQQASVWSPHSNGLMNTPHETSLPERNSHEKSQPHVLNHRNGGKSGCPDLRQPSSGSKLYSHVNGTSHLPERVLEFGRLGHLQSEPITVETGRQLNQGSVLAQNTNISTPTRGTHKTKAISLKEQERYGFIQNTNISTPTRGTHKTKAISLEEQERIDAQSYKLKDDDDFPPLTDLNGKGSAPYNVKSNKS